MNIKNEKINTYWTGSEDCPICQHNDWLLMENVWGLIEFRENNLIVGGPVLPLVAVMCNVCGHTIFFNAFAVGALKRGDEDETEEKHE
jgi:hypothetical protein